jgi:hypothetical protein
MEGIKESTIESELRKQLTPYFETRGLTFHKSDGNPNFFLKKSEVTIHFFFNIFSDSSIAGGFICLEYSEVERIIKKVGSPHNNFDYNDKVPNSFMTTAIIRSKNKALFRMKINRIEDIQEYSQAFISFYVEEFMPVWEKIETFIGFYGWLMDGKKWQDVLHGTGVNYLRYLLVLRLNNDGKFLKEFQEVDKSISTIKEWSPYWEKFKNEISNMEPNE